MVNLFIVSSNLKPDLKKIQVSILSVHLVYPSLLYIPVIYMITQLSKYIRIFKLRLTTNLTFYIPNLLCMCVCVCELLQSKENRAMCSFQVKFIHKLEHRCTQMKWSGGKFQLQAVCFHFQRLKSSMYNMYMYQGQ